MYRTVTTRIWSAVALVALIQSAVLAWMVWDRVALLKTGREIILTVNPVDPRALFRGDYVILNYDVASITTPGSRKDLKRNDTVYLTLQQQGDGSWTHVNMSADFPQIKTAQAVLRGRIQSVWHDEKQGQSTVRLKFGIENYFVPEGTGRRLEKQVGDRKVRAIIALAGDGEAALKGLEVAGKRVLDPPLF